MRGKPVVVVGAGIGGLACAVSLAARGARVTVVEAAPGPGGRMRQTFPAGLPVDSGPTVLTLTAVFEELFAQTGERLSDHLSLQPLSVLARHAWSASDRLDLHADHQQSRAAIADFAGGREADGFDRFCQDARTLYEGLYLSFMRSQRPGLLQFAARLGPLRAFQLRAGQPFASLWSTLGRYFHDPRLRQLFGRYATYVGSSPYEAPAVLMLIAQVEMNGVHAVQGGMAKLAQALAELGARRGVEFHYGQRVAQILTEGGRVCGIESQDGMRQSAAAVVFNGDPGALLAGGLGGSACSAVAAAPPAPSMSALTYAWQARARGFPLAYHSVFFSDDYAREFEQLFGRRELPAAPTVYLCAQDRITDQSPAPASERLFAIINAPALRNAQDGGPDHAARARAREAALALLARCGLELQIEGEVCTGPAEFAQLFPGTAGAIYGQACHGWKAPFARPGARSRLPGLYLTGGGVHPGPGVPMVAISGQLAADAVAADLAG
jgi:1-hydroxycarotenoid 3,4-desaturase